MKSTFIIHEVAQILRDPHEMSSGDDVITLNAELKA